MSFTNLKKGYDNNAKRNLACLKDTGVRNLLCSNRCFGKKVRLERSYKVRSQEKGIESCCFFKIWYMSLTYDK